MDLTIQRTREEQDALLGFTIFGDPWFLDLVAVVF